MTQRAMYPESTVEVTLDPSDLKDGDFAGLCVLQGMLWMDWCDQRIWALLYRNVEQKTAGLYVS